MGQPSRQFEAPATLHKRQCFGWSVADGGPELRPTQANRPVLAQACPWEAWCPYRDAFAQLQRLIADLAFVGGFLGCAGIALAARPHRRTQARHYPSSVRVHPKNAHGVFSVPCVRAGWLIVCSVCALCARQAHTREHTICLSRACTSFQVVSQ